MLDESPGCLEQIVAFAGGFGTAAAVLLGLLGAGMSDASVVFSGLAVLTAAALLAGRAWRGTSRRTRGLYAAAAAGVAVVAVIWGSCVGLLSGIGTH